jgi:hypothetical protein
MVAKRDCISGAPPEGALGAARRAGLRLGLAVPAAAAAAAVGLAGCGQAASRTPSTEHVTVASAVSPTPSAGGTASPQTASATAPAQTATAGTPAPAATPAPVSPPRMGPPRPAIIQSPIPFGARRKAEMVAYAQRHYGLDTYRLIDPHVIVIHFTETPDFSSTWNTFAPDVPDSELHELPGTCAHFVIDKGGQIHQLVPVGIMCRHTVGLNWTAIGIEHVGYSDEEVLQDRRQISASLKLVRWLRCRFRIRVGDVIGHNESLASPYHHERIASLRTQTHNDFKHADMQVYRARLRAAGGC